MDTTFIQILLVVHFLYHLIAMIGVAGSLYHQHNKHKKSKWKIAAAILWLVLSVYMLMATHEHQNDCHTESNINQTSNDHAH